MRIITDETDIGSLTKQELFYLYNGMDCLITYQLRDILLPKVEEEAVAPYEYEMAMLPVAMDMMLRGMKIDHRAMQLLLEELYAKKQKYAAFLDELAMVLLDQGVNHQSDKQLKVLFYDVLGITPIKKRDGNAWKVTTNREALEKIEKENAKGRVFATLVLALRDIDKQTSVLTAERDADGRLRTSFNVAGTETWRWSSSASPAYSGINFQNVNERLRRVFVPDDGYVLYYADLDQAESRVVAYLSSDDNYINACESGDLHTYVTQMVWPDLEWTGDAGEDRELAERNYLRGFSRRDLCKRAGHGTNYGLQAASLSRHLQIKVREASRFQLQYYGGAVKYEELGRWHEQDRDGGFDKLIEEGSVVGVAPGKGEKDKRLVYIEGNFPGIRKWHDTVAAELEMEGKLTNPFGFTRKFWGRSSDSATLRSAIAFLPQSTVGILTSIGLYRIWKELPEVQLLANIHDAALGQIPEKKIDKLAPLVIDCMMNPLDIGGKLMTIPSSLEVGMNWGHVVRDEETRDVIDNPNGLDGWKES
tara:strand:- start:3154 stop:4752 length:1599 start_codon:yes stop_codon:yes gene_type:complete